MNSENPYQPPKQQVDRERKPTKKPFWDRRITLVEILIAVVIIAILLIGLLWPAVNYT